MSEPTPYRIERQVPGYTVVIDHGPCEKVAVGAMCADCWLPLPDDHDWPQGETMFTPATPQSADECDEGCWGFTLEECGHGPENAETACADCAMGANRADLNADGLCLDCARQNAESTTNDSHL